MVVRRSIFDDHRLFVGNLVDSVTTQDLDSLFSKYGKVTNVWVARNPPGFGFVVCYNLFHLSQTFDDPRDAKDALIELNGKDLHGNSYPTTYHYSVISVEVGADRIVVREESVLEVQVTEKFDPEVKSKNLIKITYNSSHHLFSSLI
uniref:RNA-binding protein, putative n=1 Tax=Theileria annulata TaxID=5874 RepID=A0A3B0N4B1_THEAN